MVTCIPPMSVHKQQTHRKHLGQESDNEESEQQHDSRAAGGARRPANATTPHLRVVHLHVRDPWPNAVMKETDCTPHKHIPGK